MQGNNIRFGGIANLLFFMGDEAGSGSFGRQCRPAPGTGPVPLLMRVALQRENVGNDRTGILLDEREDSLWKYSSIQRVAEPRSTPSARPTSPTSKSS
jgi:hypothetical protein